MKRFAFLCLAIAFSIAATGCEGGSGTGSVATGGGASTSDPHVPGEAKKYEAKRAETGGKMPNVAPAGKSKAKNR
jgi:hypothetical protein